MTDPFSCVVCSTNFHELGAPAPVNIDVARPDGLVDIRYVCVPCVQDLANALRLRLRCSEDSDNAR